MSRVFFTDRNLGKQFPAILAAAGHQVNEREAVMQHNVALLIVIGHAPYPLLARNVVAALPKIEAFLDAQKPPFIAKVYRPSPADLARNPAARGEVMRWYPR